MAILQLDHAEDDAVDVEHEIRATLQVAMQSDLLHDHEIIRVRVFPGDELHRFGDFARINLHGHTVAKQRIHRLVVVVEAAVGIVRFNAEQLAGAADLLHRVTGLHQVAA